MRTLLALLLLALAVPAFADSPNCTPGSGTCTATLIYTEPTTLTSGVPLTNLQDGVFTYQKDGGPAQVLTVPASKPQGGGTLSVQIAPQTIPVCTRATLTGSLVMRTATGQLSSPTAAPPLTLDRSKMPDGTSDPSCVTPSPSTGVTFR